MGGANDAYVRSVSFSHDGRHIATVSDDRLRMLLCYNYGSLTCCCCVFRV